MVFTICLSILTAFMASGAIGMFVANERMSYAVNSYDDVISSNFDDLRRYVDNLGTEINFVVLNNFNFTKNVIFRDLDNIGLIVGDPMSDVMDPLLAPDMDVFLELLNYEKIIKNVARELRNIDSNMSKLQEDDAELQTQLNETQAIIASAQQMSGCGIACQSINTSVLTMGEKFQQLTNDTSAQMAALNSTSQSGDFADSVSNNLQGSSSAFSNVPAYVTNDTRYLVKELKSALNNVTTTIQEDTEKIIDQLQLINGHLFSLQYNVSGVVHPAVKYNTVRWILWFGLSMIVLLAVIFQMVGILCGVFGHEKWDRPKDRNSVSNNGGRFLMAAVTLVKIFSWLLMLATVVLFAVGSNLNKLVCQGILDDSQYTVLKEVVDGPGGITCPGCDSYALSRILLGNGTIPLTVSGTLAQCINNQPAYPTFKLNYMFNLDSISDYTKMDNINSIINETNLNLSEVNVLPSSAKQLLDDLVTMSEMDFDSIKHSISQNITLVDLDAYASNLEDVAYNNDTSDPAKSKLLLAANQLRNISRGIYSTVHNDVILLLAQLNKMQSDTTGLPEMVNETLNNLVCLGNSAKALFVETIKNQSILFATRLMRSLDSFVNHTLFEINNEVGRCLPLWNLWKSLGSISICRYTIDTLNCFWFCIGWSMFFMIPSVVLNFKLAKHFSRMDHSEEFDQQPPGLAKEPKEPVCDEKDNLKNMQLSIISTGKAFIFRSAKVSPCG